MNQPHAWEIGSGAWGCQYDGASDGYVAKLLGRVSAVGNSGVMVRLANPEDGEAFARLRDHDVWPTRAAVDAEIASRPRRRS